MFHVKDGWYFERLDKNTIRLAKTSNSCVHELIMTQAEWESVKKEVEVEQARGRGAKISNPPPKPVSKPVSNQSKAAVVTA